MILKFNRFISEKLSYSDDVESISDYLIQYLEDKEEWNDEEIIKINNPNIKEVRIQFDESVSVPSFVPYKSDFNKRMIFLRFNPNEITHGNIHHEVFHGFDWIKSQGNDLTKSFEWAIINLDEYFEDDDILSKIVHTFYLMSDAEIKSNFNQDIFVFKKYVGKNALTKKDVDSLIEETETFENYQFVKNFNLNQELNKLDNQKMDEFMSVVKQMENLKPGEEEEVLLKKFTELERKLFVDKLNTIFTKQKNKLVEYLGKLIVHYRNYLK